MREPSPVVQGRLVTEGPPWQHTRVASTAVTPGDDRTGGVRYWPCSHALHLMVGCMIVASTTAYTHTLHWCYVVRSVLALQHTWMLLRCFPDLFVRYSTHLLHLVVRSCLWQVVEVIVIWGWDKKIWKPPSRSRTLTIADWKWCGVVLVLIRTIPISISRILIT